MARGFLTRLYLAVTSVCLLIIPAASQPSCPVPPSIQPIPHELNIFSDQQEVYLGDALAEQVGLYLKIIDDDPLNAYLRAVGNRLVQHLPATQMNFRFYLIELPEVNAFSIAGGRVYVSRKMVALAKTDDELAGVLAHELGHIVTHQSAIEISARLREVLGVTQIGDRADVFDKVHLLVENAARKPGRRTNYEEKQYVADQVALYAMARAGYAPHAYVELWDRFQQTHGKTGNWLSDFFGGTKPSERRLREMLKGVSALPAGCAEIPPGSRTAVFANWQAEVINYNGFGSKESLPGLVFKQKLALPLRPDVSNLRFSPDGKYVLAQDEGGIHVLTRDPLEVLFYIPALDAHDATFAPDSRSIVFHTRALRVESWSIEDQRRTSAHEITVLHPCIQTELSPDGSTLACLNSQFDLSLIDVASGSTLAAKKSFTQATGLGLCMVAMSAAEGSELWLLEMRFSPDARYFVAGARGAHFAWDLSAHHEIPLSGSIKDILKSSFTFLAPDRIVGIDVSSPAKSPVLRFPTGERLQQVRLANGIRLRPTAHGNYLFVSPLKDAPMGLLDMNSGELPISFKSKAADVYDELLLTERLTGELAFHVVGKIDSTATVKLPQGRLGPLRAAVVSPDFNWMALSNRTRGAIWDVTHNIRTMETRPFHGAWFDSNDSLYVDLAKFMETERRMVHLDPASGNGTTGYKIGDAFATQHGQYLLVTKTKPGKVQGNIALGPEFFCLERFLRSFGLLQMGSGTDEEIELRDVRDGHVVWSHHFPHEVPSVSVGAGKLLLRWALSENGGHDELARFPQLKSSAGKDDYLLEEVELGKDTPTGAMLIKTNKRSFFVNHALQVGDWTVVTASGNQVLVYAFPTGQEKSHFFGRSAVASGNGLLAIESESGQVSVYDMANSQLKQQYTFADPVSFKTFSPDGNRLFVVTASQRAYILDVNSKN